MAQGSFPQAGEFELLKAVILTSSGKSIDITPNVLHIAFFEDTTKHAVSGNILFQNSFAATSWGPLVGQEFLELRIKTQGFEDPESNINYTKNVLHIHSIENRTIINNGIEMVLMNFITTDILKNQRTKIFRSLKGSYSDIVKGILKGDIDCKKDLYIEPTVGNKHITVPNMRPFDLINLCAREAISKEKGTPHYLFFETFRGYHFRSLQSLYPAKGKGGQLEKPMMVYNAIADPGDNLIKSGSGRGTFDPVAGSEMVLEHEVVAASDSIMNFQTGVYASTLITHDIQNKQFTTSVFNYLDEFSKENVLDDNPIFSGSPLEEGNKKSRVSDFPTRTFVQPTAIDDLKKRTDAYRPGGEPNNPFLALNPEQWLQKRTSRLLQTEQGFIVTIKVHGNTVVSAGDMIKLDLPLPMADSSEPAGAESVKTDLYYKGTFFVKRIRHDFDFSIPRHTMRLTLVKDALPTILESDDKAAEPKPKQPGEVIEKFY